MSMYSLEDDVRNEPQERQGSGMFADGVKFKRMVCDDGSELRFRLLPAHHPSSAQLGPSGEILVDPNSWIPFRDESGKLTAWGRKIMVSQFVGHGDKKSGGIRRTLVSLVSYNSTPGEVYCPLVHLLQVIRAEQANWGYLVKDKLGPDGKTVVEPKAISATLSPQLLCNVVDIANLQEGVMLGLFSKSAYDKLLSPDGGLAYQRNAGAAPADVAQNPMMQWACGDLTHPTNGPVLSLSKEQVTDKSRRFRGYTITYATTPAGVLRLPVAELLPRRYNLLDLNSIIPRPTEESLVAQLVELLNGISPSGEHEYSLLRHVFGNQFRIPEPPVRAYAPGSTGLGARPSAGVPAVAPDSAMSTVAPAQPAAIPQMAWPQLQSTVNGMIGTIGGQSGYAGTVPAAPQPSAVPPMIPQAAPQQAAAPQPIPGDAIRPLEREAFLARLKRDAAGSK